MAFARQRVEQHTRRALELLERGGTTYPPEVVHRCFERDNAVRAIEWRASVKRK